ncbi:MAG: hypothetical protein U9Q81_00335 [Pseudomonadota bacterium]|nr:hypothetical protein [Pseudomonadota bacterium]
MLDLINKALRAKLDSPTSAGGAAGSYPADTTCPESSATTFSWRSIPALAERINSGADSPTMTEHALRHYVRNADANGLRPYVRRLGRKILVNEPGFVRWLEQAGGK